MNDMKPWSCPSRKHVLGQVTRNGNGVRQLLLYRHAVTLTDRLPAEIDIMAVVEGYVLDVRCDLCGQVRTWVPGAEALKQLLESWQELHDDDR